MGVADLNLIAAIECASAGPSSPGGFDVRLLRAGWKFVIEQFAPSYKAGVRTLLLHRPNGESLEGDIMNLDSRVDLMRDPQAKALIGQHDRFLEQFHRAFPDARIIAYLGSTQEPDWAERAKRQDFSALIDRLGRSLKPWIDCPFCDLCFDHAGSFDADDPHGGFVVFVHQLLAMAGRTVYVEPQPKPWSVTASMPSLMQESWWRQWADKSRPAIRWLMGEERDHPESEWIHNGQPDVHGFVRDCKATNCTPMINVPWIDQLFEKETA